MNKSQLMRYMATVLAGAVAAVPYYERVLATQPASLIQYLRLNETSGATAVDSSPEANNGAYSAGVELANAAGPDGVLCPKLDGADYIALYSAALNTDMNKGELTVAGWMKVSAAGDWSDATVRQIVAYYVDSNNRVYIEKSATANRLSLYYTAGGTVKQVNIATVAPTGWVHLAITVTKAGDAMKVYMNGVQSGATQTGLGTWAGSLLGIRTNLGSFDQVPTAPFKGWLSNWALWKTALSDAEVLALANPL